MESWQVLNTSRHGLCLHSRLHPSGTVGTFPRPSSLKVPQVSSSTASTASTAVSPNVLCIRIGRYLWQESESCSWLIVSLSLVLPSHAVMPYPSPFLYFSPAIALIPLPFPSSFFNNKSTPRRTHTTILTRFSCHSQDNRNSSASPDLPLSLADPSTALPTRKVPRLLASLPLLAVRQHRPYHPSSPW